MIRSRDIALRCAASLPPFHRGPKVRRKFYIKKWGRHRVKQHLLPHTFLDQLDACKSEEARRLLLGVSR
jgi:hypothetical protein